MPCPYHINGLCVFNVTGSSHDLCPSSLTVRFLSRKDVVHDSLLQINTYWQFFQIQIYNESVFNVSYYATIFVIPICLLPPLKTFVY